VASAQDFDWSWEEGKDRDRPAAVPEPEADVIEEEVVPGESFNWQWNTGGAATSAAPRVKPARTGVAPQAYQDLLDENRELRRKLAEQERLRQDARREADGLRTEHTALKTRFEALGSTISDLERQRADAATGAQQADELRERLQAVETEKAAMQDRLENLRRRLEDAEQRAAAPVEIVEVVPPSAGTAVQPGSDLFRKVEEENTKLREQIAALEAEKQRLAEQAAAIEPATTAAAGAETAEPVKSGGSDREAVAQILQRLPHLERQLEDLRRREAEKDARLTARDRELQTVKAELVERERRLVKAERMAALLDRAREEVRGVGDREKRDMHYNMAAVYAKEGRFREAEQEYHRALRIDPKDAAAHYNLGILYDDELNDKRRAALHYRKYLQLAPSAPDVDQVRAWLLRLQMEL
jgi:tetratricopeptide (TPR) repeat protein